MKTVYKYPIELYVSTIEIYREAEILSIGYDPIGQLCLWALIDTEHEKEFITILTVGTGWELPENGLEFIDTIKDGPYMWHVFKADENSIYTNMKIKRRRFNNVDRTH